MNLHIADSPATATPFAASPAASAMVSSAQAAEAGLCAQRLGRLTDFLQQGVEQGEIPGAVALVARRGRIAYLASLGWRDRAARAPMHPDSLFRIASMSKPITSMAALMLMEEGRLCLSDPVSRHLPEFDGLKLARVERDGAGQPLLREQPCAQAMSVQDLLRHTSGLGYGFTGQHPVKQRYQREQVASPDITLAEHVRRLARIPLMHVPGSTWEYGLSTDVLGRVIEVVSGLPLDRFIRERITAPLGMDDTGFHVPPQQAQRAAYPQAEGPNGTVPSVPDPLAARAFLSGGGGMVSSAADYARLCQCWLNGGQLDGVRLLSRSSMALMTSDHLPAGLRFGEEMAFLGAGLPSPALGYGFGLGFAVRTAAGLQPLLGSVGMYSWSGIYGTSFWVDPQEQLFAVLMTQHVAQRSRYRRTMQNLVYQAIAD